MKGNLVTNVVKKQEKIIICPSCGEEKKHYAKGLCANCYKVQAHRERKGTIVKYCSECGKRIYSTENTEGNETKCSICKILEEGTKSKNEKERVILKYNKLYSQFPEVVTEATQIIWEAYLSGKSQIEIAKEYGTSRQNVSGVIKRIKEKLNHRREVEKELVKIMSQGNYDRREMIETILLTASTQDLRKIADELKQKQQKVG